jgi:peptidoglycan hydrolase-like protein with peptidoglycan-binding domain
MSNRNGRTLSIAFSLAIVMALVVPALGQRRITVPAGTVIALRLDTHLSSDTSRIGDRFTATVFRSIVVDGRVVIPESTKVEGHVTGATSTERGSKAGTISVAFDRMVFSAGSPVQIDCTLTSLNEEARHKIEQDTSYQESAGRVRHAVVFIGAGGGPGATIGAVGGGNGETTTAGAILGALLGSGERAEVRPGAEFGMMVERSFSVDTFNVADERTSSDPDWRASSQAASPSADSIRSAQIALRGRHYYDGPVNGMMSRATHDAIQNFQRDRNIAITGELDVATSRALGIPADTNGYRGGNVGVTGIGNPRQITLLANRLLQDFQRDLNMRNNRGQASFDTRRDFKPNEVELLFQITSLQAAAELYNQLTSSITDPDAVKGAASGLMRQAHFLERIMRRDPQLTLSSTVSADWQQLQTELARISVTDANQDGDNIR